MNRNSSKHSFIGTGGWNLHTNGIHNAPVTGLLSHRQIMSLTNTTATENSSSNIDLFSRNRRNLSVASSDESDLQVRLERLSSGATKPAKGVLDDLLSSNEGGKHDYDWLLTPPETPMISSSNGKEYQPKAVAPGRNRSVRSGSTNRTSRLSVSQSESNHLSRPASSSVTRQSITTTQNTNRNSNILNTSSASVSSYIRPSTPTSHSPSTAKPSTRTTPSRSRPSSTTTTTSIDRITRPSTPTRPQSPTVRPASRPSTPTRRNPTPSNSITPLFNNRSVGPTSRPNSPVSRVRAPPQPINLPDFPNETPPNLRTSLPERPVSAGRSRPGAVLTVKGNVENTNTRRPSSPIIAKGRLAEPPGRGRLHANGHAAESTTRKPTKVLNSENGTGFGRSISKKSLDMAIKHMDIRTGAVRPLSGSALFPHSIRSGHGSSASNNVNSKNATFSKVYPDKRVKPVSVEHKLTHVDMYESLRYDSILLKEDWKNTSWLHSADEKSDQSPLFDNGFEPLPEPFAPL